MTQTDEAKEEKHILIGSKNISSWKGPLSIIKSNFLLLTGLPKIKSYD